MSRDAAGARRCSRPPRRTTERNATAARGRGAGTQERTRDRSPKSSSCRRRRGRQTGRRSSSRVERIACPTAGRRPGPRRCGRTARCRRSWRCRPAPAAWRTDSPFGRRRRTSASTRSPCPARVVANPVDQCEVRFPAGRVEADQRPDQRQPDQLRADGGCCGGSIHVAAFDLTGGQDRNRSSRCQWRFCATESLPFAGTKKRRPADLDGHAGRLF